MFPFTNIQDHDMLDLTFDWNSEYICLQNQAQTLKMEEQLRNLKELNLRKNLNRVSKDPDKNLTDPSCFDHYLTLHFHNLNIKNTVVS